MENVSPYLNFVSNIERHHLSRDLIFQSEIGTEGNVWLFEFSSETTHTEEMLLSSIRNYFNNFNNIFLLSEIYVLASINDSFKVFEVYRKSPKFSITVMMLCQLTKDKIQYINKNEIWTRRKDLSGIHFSVGCIKYYKLIFKKDEVKILILHLFINWLTDIILISSKNTRY